MKKKIKILISVITIVLFSIVSSTREIKADIGMVNWDPYYAWCIRKEGITIKYNAYGDNTVYVPYGARIYIWHGNNMDKAYDQNDSYMAYYGDYSFSFSSSIKGSDIRPVYKNPDKELLSYDSLKLMALKTVDIYDGPSEDYKKLFSIDKDTVFISDYNDGMWAHIIFEEREGWVYYNQTSIKDVMPGVIIVNDNHIKINSDNEISIYDSLNANEPIHKISVEEESLSYIGLCSSSFVNKAFYVSYENNKNGWIFNRDNNLIFEVNNNTLFSNEDVVLYNSLDNEEVSTIIQAGETAIISRICFDSDGNERYYCEYNGKNGWTNSGAKCFVDKSILNNHEKGFVENDAELYSMPDGNKVGGTMNANEEFVILSSIKHNNLEWNYVKNETKEGWINQEVKYYSKDENAEVSETVEERVMNNSIPSIFYYYGFGAVIVALSTLVLIRYLNITKKAQ